MEQHTISFVKRIMFSIFSVTKYSTHSFSSMSTSARNKGYMCWVVYKYVVPLRHM